jgi:hypothetical protein
MSFYPQITFRAEKFLFLHLETSHSATMMISLHSYHPAVKFIPENNPVFSVLSQFIIGDWNMKTVEKVNLFDLFHFSSFSRILNPSRCRPVAPAATHLPHMFLDKLDQVLSREGPCKVYSRKC